MQNPLTLSLVLGLFPITWMGITSLPVLLQSRAIAATATPSNGLILQVNGNAQLERQALRVRPLPGMPIYPGDRLLATGGGELVVLCLDFTMEVISEEGRPLCGTAPPPACDPDTYRCPPRGDLEFASNEGIPYVLSPRRTNLLNPRPQLRWNPVAGASQYTVSLLEDGAQLWQVSTSGTQLDYPSERPLRSGVEYLLVIETDTGALSIDELPIPGGFGFRLLSEEQHRELLEAQAQIETQIEAQGLEESARNLALSFLYIQQGSIADAIDILKNLREGGTNNAPICNWLGELYLDYLKLPKHAIERELEPNCQLDESR